MWLLRVASFYRLLTFNQHLFSKEKASLSLEVKLITKAVKVITKAGEMGTSDCRTQRGDSDPSNSHHKMAALRLQLLPLVSI